MCEMVLLNRSYSFLERMTIYLHTGVVQRVFSSAVFANAVYILFLRTVGYDNADHGYEWERMVNAYLTMYI